MRRFLPSDLDELNGWRMAQGQAPLRGEQLSRFGAMEPGVAACFLYVTDSDLGFLEALVTNPEQPADTRHAAILAAWEMLFTEAKRLGLHRLFAIPVHESALKRCIQFGMRANDDAKFCIMEVR